MSEVKADDQRLIASHNDVWETYTGAGNAIKTGVEVELCYFNPQSRDLAPMNPAQNKAVREASNEAMGRGDWFRNEPTADVLEIGTFACPPNHKCLKNIIDDNNRKIALLSEKGREQGLKRSYFQEFPEKTDKQLFEGLLDIPRYQTFFNPPRADFTDIATYFSVCKSNQVSVSYRTPDHLLENLRRLYALTPALFLITDNSSGFNQGKAHSGHLGMHLRASLKDRGGVPPYLYTAKKGEDYLRAHIDHVMTGPMFAHYDDKGALVAVPSGRWTSLEKLANEGLNTASNYFLSESILWPDVKIAALKDPDGTVNGHRYEARALGVGLHQHQSALLIIAGLAFKESFAAKTDILLQNYGFPLKDDPAALQKPIENAYSAARNHEGMFLDIRYGTGRMLDFTREFANLLEDAFNGDELDDELEPILDICRSGETDGKINRREFPSLEAALDFQRSYDDRIFDNPNRNARMLFSEESAAQHKTA